MKRRFETHFKPNAAAKGLRPGHPALIEARTIFPSTVVDVENSPRVLVSGVNQRKIGGLVSKGRWRGMPIFCLTLEERATCPTSCLHWSDCYGNGMHHSRRHRHGPALEARLPLELAALQSLHPRGFVVRLHILGEFYSSDYVRLWQSWIFQFPALHVFGYTAHPIDSDIGVEVAAMNDCFSGRSYIRFSRAWPSMTHPSAITIPDASHPTDAIICPAQTDRTDACSSCGLCWTTDRAIAFLQHGRDFSRGARQLAA